MHDIGDTLVKTFIGQRFESQFAFSSSRSSPGVFSPLQRVLATTSLSVLSTRLLALPLGLAGSRVAAARP
jgi:hypothetical protein